MAKDAAAAVMATIKAKHSIDSVDQGPIGFKGGINLALWYLVEAWPWYRGLSTTVSLLRPQLSQATSLTPCMPSVPFCICNG